MNHFFSNNSSNDSLSNNSNNNLDNGLDNSLDDSLDNTLDKKQEFSLFLGNILEHFEAALYGFLTPILSPAFFPNYDPVVQLILGYSFLGSSLITKPLGAIIFGILAKRFQAKRLLSHSILGVALATLFIAFLPGFQTLGWLAPCSLLLLKMLKSIFAAGESALARILIVDSKEKKLAIRTAYYYETSTMLGIVFGSFLSNLIIHYQGYSEGCSVCWRLGFFMGGMLGIVAYGLRRFQGQYRSYQYHAQYYTSQDHSSQKIIQTQSIQSGNKPKNSNPSKLIDFKALGKQRGILLRILFVYGFSYITYAVPFLLFNTLIPLISDISLEKMMTLNSYFLVLDLLLIPIIGRRIERYPARVTLAFAALILAVTIIPIFVCLPNISFWLVTFFRFWVVFWGVVFSCPINAWLNQLLSENPDRFLLLGIGESLGGGLIGHTMPAVCLTLWKISGSLVVPAIYLSVIMLGCFFSVALFPKKEAMSNLEESNSAVLICQ